MSRLEQFAAATGWRDRAAWDAVQEECWLAPGEDGIALRRRRYAPFFQQMGAGVRIDQGCRFSSPWRIALDDEARLNREVIIEGSSAVRIGRNARIGHRVFIHSANHDVSPTAAEALFERSHLFQPVWLGDNVLISANVTILPGAFIDGGSFVAAGALVTAKRFAGPVQLAGVPARPFKGCEEEAAPLARPAPELAFIAKRGETRTVEALKLLATVLGCPQVTVLTDDAEIPPSVRAIVALGDAAVAADPAVPLYKVVPGEPIAAPNWAESFALPVEITQEFVINGFASARTLATVAAATCFYASNAYLKRPPKTRKDGSGEWAVCLALALDDPPSAMTWQEVIERLGPLRESATADVLSGDTLDALVRHETSKLDAETGEFFRNPTSRDFGKVRALFLAAPHLLALWTWLHRKDNKTVCIEFLVYMQPYMKTAARLAGLGCAYALLSRDKEARGVVDTLLGGEWTKTESCLIRAAPTSNSPAIQPVVVALLLWALCRDTTAPEVFGQVRRIALTWKAVAEPRMDALGVASAGLFDRDGRTISSSLLENWLLLQKLPQGGDAHYYLADTAYQDPCARIENAWSDILRDIAHAVGCPYLRLKPWPAGYDFALSLRYDVDRQCSAAQVVNIVRIQKEQLGAACGSWYFFAAAEFNSRIRNVLRGWNQEDAVHFCRPADGRPNRGATAHSGSNSEYWRGASTIAGLLAAGATYGEAMLSRWSVARPGWSGESRSELWLTPLHFPLEGTVAETTTQFFDQRIQAFRSQIASGGHVIVGSHPDCNQDILDEVLDREDLSRAWAVPVDAAVRRCKSILDYGAVRLVGTGTDPNMRTLVATDTLADLAIDVWLPGEAAARTISTQLNANIPRTIGIAPPADAQP
jgi:acetyltransferase-like isoleucine patch superfamily enzyme